MAHTIVLADRGDENKVIEEEKEEWIINVLEALGINRELLSGNYINQISSHGIEVWNNYDGSVDIFRFDGQDNKKIVGQWRVPTMVLKKETLSKWYYEIHLNEWATPFLMEKRRK